MDRGINYDILIDFIEEHKEYNYVFMYESGMRVYKNINDKECCYLTKDLLEAVKTAKEITSKGNAIILSPAAASYGYFKNFEERGDIFKNLIKK